MIGEESRRPAWRVRDAILGDAGKIPGYRKRISRSEEKQPREETMIGNILQREFYHNRISEYLLCLAITVGGILAVRAVEALVLRRLKAWAGKTSSTWDNFFVDRIHRTGIPLAYLGIVQASLRVLTLTPRVERIIDMAGIVLLTLLLSVFTVSLVRYGFEEYMRKQGEDASRERALKGVVSLAKALVWVVGTLFLLDNLGLKIASVAIATALFALVREDKGKEVDIEVPVVLSNLSEREVFVGELPRVLRVRVRDRWSKLAKALERKANPYLVDLRGFTDETVYVFDRERLRRDFEAEAVAGLPHEVERRVDGMDLQDVEQRFG